MSMLTDGLPDSVIYKGESYGIRTDFRDWLRFYDSGRKKDIVGMLKIYRKLPPSAAAAVELANGFGSGGALGYRNTTLKRPLIDYELDAPLIYAAFMGEYGIDLCETEMHWYKFCALMNGLSGERRICEIMSIRGTELSAVENKKRRAEIRRLQSIYACPDTRSAEERDMDISRALGAFY